MEYPPSSARAAPAAWAALEVRHLRALQSVVAAGSFHGAAAHLGYTQSAVSAQIRALERLAGARLLERTRGSRRIRLTREGAILLRYASEIVTLSELVFSQLLAGEPRPSSGAAGTPVSGA